MMSPEIYDWEATLHKMVTSKEGDLVGNVDANSCRKVNYSRSEKHLQ
jgi:hypothetical protein